MHHVIRKKLYIERFGYFKVSFFHFLNYKLNLFSLTSGYPSDQIFRLYIFFQIEFAPLLSWYKKLERSSFLKFLIFGFKK